MSAAENSTNSNSNEGSGASPSPGKGGKFLELMQKRIMAEQQQQKQQPSSGPGTEPNAQVQNQNQVHNQLATDGAILQQQPPPVAAGAPIGVVDTKQLPISRPKGKDFATMSSRGPIPSILPQPQQPSQMQIQQPQIQQQQISTSAPPAGKPKGKDFSAMASRMAVPIPAPAPAAPLHSQPMIQNPIANDQAAQVARAAQMQAEARAAAGLPPLSKPSKWDATCATKILTYVLLLFSNILTISFLKAATTVTTSLSGIPSPRVNIPNQPQQQQYPGMVNAQQPQQHHPPHQQQQYSQSRTSSQGFISTGHQQSQHQQHQSQFSSTNNPIYGSGMASTQDPLSRLPNVSSNNSATGSLPTSTQRGSRPTPVMTSPQTAAYRPSKTATTNTSASKPREPTGRTPQPSIIESKVTMQSSAAISSAVHPYMAPLVGQRIQDLVSSLDPSYTIDSQAQEQLLQLTDDFLDKVCKQSLRLATHRGSAIMEVQDVQMVLAKQWGIVIPGLGPPVLNKSRVAPIPSSTTNSGTSNRQTSGTKRKSSSGQKSSSTSTTTGTAHHPTQPNKSSKQNESNHVTA